MGGEDDVHEHVGIVGEGIAADTAAGDLLTEAVPAGDDDVELGGVRGAMMKVVLSWYRSRETSL